EEELVFSLGDLGVCYIFVYDGFVCGFFHLGCGAWAVLWFVIAFCVRSFWKDIGVVLFEVIFFVFLGNLPVWVNLFYFFLL
ncbi:APH(3') family aminoglycoside O-phosphotransferase, partial [Enterococcus faecalis]